MSKRETRSSSKRETPSSFFIFIRPWRWAFLAAIVALVVLVALGLGVIWFGWGWTGFTGGDSQVIVKRAAEDTIYLPSKTLWDWMQLLLVAVLLAVGGFWFSQYHLNGANLFQFDLSKFHLNWANLHRADLHKAILHGAILHGADLSEADLSEADLGEADLSEANLNNARLRGADLSNARLNNARLHMADLSGARFRGADLSGADLFGDMRSEVVRRVLRLRLHVADLRGAKGLTVDQRVYCWYNGALVDRIPSPPASSTPRHDGEQGQSPTPAQVAETSHPAGDTAPPVPQEDGAAPPTHPDTPS